MVTQTHTVAWSGGWVSHECHVCVLLLLIELACDPTRTADVAAVIMHEGKCQVGSRLYKEEDYHITVSYCVCVQVWPMCVW